MINAYLDVDVGTSGCAPENNANVRSKLQAFDATVFSFKRKLHAWSIEYNCQSAPVLRRSVLHVGINNQCLHMHWN